jgi:uncharacterized protein (TIGR03435 family)
VKLFIPGPPVGKRGEPVQDEGPNDRDLISTVENQLGLKLAVHRGSAEMLVIDKIAKATENQCAAARADLGAT